MRNCFRKEFKKIKSSQKLDAAADDIYKPRLWYFEELSFLTNQETPRQSVCNIEEHNVNENSSAGTVS